MIVDISENVAHWLAHGERGLSSNAIVGYLTGIPGVASRWGFDTPLDPADLRRCDLLLTACPELHRPFLERMPSCSERWARLVAIWDDLVELLHRECAEKGGHCPDTYAVMKLALRDTGICPECGTVQWLRSPGGIPGGPRVCDPHVPGTGSSSIGSAHRRLAATAERCPGGGRLPREVGCS